MADLASVHAALDRHAAVLVAFSGGADSAFLARVAHDRLGPERVRAVTAVSPSLAADELEDCRRLAAEWGLSWSTVATDEMERAAYRVNDGERCYHCKSALMDALTPLVTAGAVVALGVNVDDLGDHRPGQRAAGERDAVFPLVEAGFTKADVRDWSRRLGLRTWDKPAAACLASRLPYGTEVSVAVLSRVERAEAALHRLGLPAVRVRHYDRTARIEVPLADLATVVERREQVVDAVRAAGYDYVTLDLEGLRSGNLNRCLAASRPTCLAASRPTACRRAPRSAVREAQATSRRRWSARWMRSGGRGSIQWRTCTPSQSTASATACARRRVRTGRFGRRSASTRTRPLSSATTDSPAVKIRWAAVVASVMACWRASAQPGRPWMATTARATSRSTARPRAAHCS